MPETKLLKLKQWLLPRFAVLVADSKAASNRTLPSVGRIQKVTFLKLDRIGDFVLATSFLRPVYEQYPHLEVTLVVRPIVSQLARQQFPKWKIIELPASPRLAYDVFLNIPLRKKIRGLPTADVLVDLRSYRSYGDAVVASWFPANFKMSVENSHVATEACILAHENYLYDLLLPRNLPNPGECGDIANYRRLYATFTGTSLVKDQQLPELIVPEKEASEIQEILSAEGANPGAEYCLVCPGASSDIREYPPEQLARAVENALSNNQNLQLVIAGTNSDQRTTAPFAEALKVSNAVHNLTGKVSLPQHVALIASAKVVISMESSHAHIAGALRTPCVVIIGGGHFSQFGPWGESETFRWLHHPMECFGCNWRCIYTYPKCIADLSATRITEAVAEILGRLAKDGPSN